MTRRYFSIGILFWLMILFISFTGINNNNQVLKMDGGPPYNTNAPQEKTCSGAEGNNSCHSGGAGDNSGPATVSIDFGGGQTTYVPNQTYTITPSITHPSRGRFGFQITALRNSTNNSTGTVTITDPTRTWKQTPGYTSLGGVPAGTRTYVMHDSVGTPSFSLNKGQWSYRWTAPATNEGPITLYACFVAANGNDTADGGDEVYYTSLVINPYITGIESDADEKLVSVYPNPADDFFYIHYASDKSSLLKADLISLEGKFVQSLITESQSQGVNARKIILTRGIPSGIYFVKINIDDKEYLRRILIK